MSKHKLENMIQNSLLIVLLLFSFSVFSQRDSTKISFVAYWAKGDSYDFKVTKIKTGWSNDILTKRDSSQYVANFKVLDSTENTYKIQWTYKNTILNSFQIKAQNLFEDKQVIDEILKKNDLSKIIYETNELGEFLHILNWKELSETTNLLMEEIVRIFELKNSENIDILKNTMSPFIEIYSSKQGIEQLAVKELQYFHYLLGYEYDITEPIVFEQEYPNMLGGDPINAEAILTFGEVDFENYYCTVKEETTLNEVDVKKTMYQFVERMNAPELKMEETLNNVFFDIKDTNIYQFYYYPGIPHYIYQKRETILKLNEINIKNLEELFIELLYDE